MTVSELIDQLKEMPHDVHVYAEGEPADKVILEECQGSRIVRIFKAWDVEYVGRHISDEYDKCYFTGEYEDQYCGNCPYKNDCSANNEDDD